MHPSDVTSTWFTIDDTGGLDLSSGVSELEEIEEEVGSSSRSSSLSFSSTELSIACAPGTYVPNSLTPTHLTDVRGELHCFSEAC